MQPQNAQEYTRRFNLNQRIEGYGLGNVHIHMPCPFCAAPDFIVYEMLEVETAMGVGATCKECERSAKALITAIAGGKSIEIVQTGGDDPPDWLTPKMRRLIA